MDKLQRYSVYGELIIPLYFPTDQISKQAAIDRVSSILNRETVLKLEGEIHTTNGKEHVIIAPDCQFRWIDAIEGNPPA